MVLMAEQASKNMASAAKLRRSVVCVAWLWITLTFIILLIILELCSQAIKNR